MYQHKAVLSVTEVGSLGRYQLRAQETYNRAKLAWLFGRASYGLLQRAQEVKQDVDDELFYQLHLCLGINARHM